MPSEQMSIEEATAYHYEQISFLEQTDADIISAYTICYVEEAVGIVEAAKSLNMPVAIAFTVETDGHLPTGTPFKDAIELVDAFTDGYPEYYLINCAHPDHFESALVGGHWLERVKGLVANASRCSHAELDDAEQLDHGNPAELAQQLDDWKQKLPHLTILGGCCGTDQRHMSAIAEKIAG